MRSQVLSLAASVLAFSSLALAQTSTSCNPLTNTTCPSDPALGKTVSIDFTSGANSLFDADAGTTMTYGADGAEFIMTSDGLAQTIESNKYIFFGKVSVTLKAANGTGVISSFVMESDDLDEIDWEWLGGNATVVETNYFGKGNTTTYNRATYPAVNNPQDVWVCLPSSSPVSQKRNPTNATHSTHTQSTGPPPTSNGTSTTSSSAPSSTPTPWAARTSLKPP